MKSRQTFSSTFLAFLLFANAVCASGAMGQSAADFVQLKEQIRQSFWQIPLRTNEQLAVQGPSAGQIQQWTQSLRPDGTWSDINYADQTRDFWETALHLKRVLAMATAYEHGKAEGRSDPALRRAILSATDLWTSKDFQNPNWWQNKIGVPNQLSDIMLLMEREMSPSEKAAGLKILNRIKIEGTGQNLAWEAGIVFKTAVLEENAAMAKTARAAILNQIAITTEEGIQPDESFHQHGPQQQLGNYGLAFAAETVNWAYIWRGTPWAMPAAQVAILRDYLLHGEAVVVRNDTMDISACGRQLFADSPAGKGRTVLNLLNVMAIADPNHAAEYHAAVAVDSVTDHAGNPSQPGAMLDKNFYRSDYVVHRRPAYYASVKMCSRRVRGEELVNGENLSGRYLADGAMFVYQTGNEYKNIFPVWDWRRLPGVTDAATGNNLKPVGKMDTDFAGGVSDGRYGAAGLDYHRDGVSARKSWFFFDHEIVCLGAGIHSATKEPLVTGIEQSLLQGDIFAGNGHGRGQAQSAQTHQIKGMRWVWHDDRGYFFPKPEDVMLSGASQTGSWSKVYHGPHTEPISRQVFSLWINQGSGLQPTNYSYVVLPSATMKQVRTYAAHPDSEIIRNTPAVQAVKSRKLGIVMAMFFSPGEIETGRGSISVDKPCAIIVHEKDRQRTITVSDPSQLSKRVHLTVRGKTYAVDLPQKGEAGKSVRVILR